MNRTATLWQAIAEAWNHISPAVALLTLMIRSPWPEIAAHLLPLLVRFAAWLSGQAHAAGSALLAATGRLIPFAAVRALARQKGMPVDLFEMLAHAEKEAELALSAVEAALPAAVLAGKAIEKFAEGATAAEEEAALRAAIDASPLAADVKARFEDPGLLGMVVTGINILRAIAKARPAAKPADAPAAPPPADHPEAPIL